MPIYDRICTKCPGVFMDRYEPMESPEVPCPDCGEPTQRAWLNAGAAVIGDEIPGGIVIRHGLVNEDGSPRTFYSKTEIAKAAREAGLTNVDRHMPERGSDKSRVTKKWF